MKTAALFKSTRLGSVIPANTLLASTVLTASLVLVGCQSTPMSALNSSATSNTPIAAKTALATALQKQRRQSFSYHSNIEISNEAQLTANTDDTLLVSDYVDEYCEDSHDQGYADLVAQAEAQDSEISATDYDTPRAALEQTYLACNQAYQAWDASQDYSDDLAYSADNNTDSVSPYYKQLFDNYDDQPKVSDVKKAQLLDAYLLKPLSINAQGVYQPLAGRFTMLGSAQYQARNNQASINQPVYIDFKTASIYIWADNFAMFNSALLDDKLGIKWQDKWLKLAIDDGTLPKGFVNAVIKTHIKALDSNYDSASVAQFDFITPDNLALSPKLSDQQLVPMLQSSQIIRRVRSLDNYKQSYTDYMRRFYTDITQQYPELIKKDKDYKTDDSSVDAQTFTSKAMVQQVLSLMKSSIDKQEVVADQASVSLPVQDLYGFNKKGKLQWHHNRSYTISSQAKRGSQITTDVLQQYLPIQSQETIFPNLPADVQVPNASNSVDIRDYSKELAEYYRNGGGMAVGKMLFSALPLYKSMYASKIEMISEE